MEQVVIKQMVAMVLDMVQVVEVVDLKIGLARIFGMVGLVDKV